MSFETGFIKRAMQHGFCYADAVVLYKKAQTNGWTPTQGVNQNKAQAFAEGFTGGSAQRKQMQNLQRFGDTAWNAAKGAGNFVKNVGYDLYAAPVVDTVKNTGDAWNYARAGNWSEATKSGGKALGNAALTALTFTPGLGVGATAAKYGLRTAAGLAKLRKAEQLASGLTRGSEVLGGNVLSQLPRAAQVSTRVAVPAAAKGVQQISTRDPLLEVEAP